MRHRDRRIGKTGVLGSDAARLAFNDARQPTLMSPVGDAADLQYLLMPVLLNR